MKFTDDPYIHETLSFLMTREVAHFKMFEAALNDIQPNFPPAVLAAEPRYTQQYFNLSNGPEVRGPWNQGEMPGMGKDFEYIADPATHVRETQGMTALEDDKAKELKAAEKQNKQLSKEKSAEVKDAEPEGVAQWSTINKPEFTILLTGRL